MRKMPCNHSFHAECIVPWLSKVCKPVFTVFSCYETLKILQTNSCPVCRHELATDDEMYEAYRKEKIRAKQREADIENLHNSMFS